MAADHLKIPISNHIKDSQSKNNKKFSQYCSINTTARSQMHKQLLFFEQKYEKMKKKLYQKKLLGDLRQQDVQEIGNLMNIIAMKYSQQGKNALAEQWLRRTLKYCEISQRLKIVTYNNLACVYKQSNDLQMALFYISKAQNQADCYCFQMEDDKLLKVVTDCSLNLCAILSAMGDHYKALRASRKALKILKSNENLPNSYYQSLFPIAKFNQAVQLQRLKMYEQAQTAYQEVRHSKNITQQLAQRTKKALQQVSCLKQKAKKQRQKFNLKSSKTSKRIRLSLHKICPSNIDEVQKHGASKQKSQVQERRKQNAKNYFSTKQKHYKSIEPKSKNRQICIQNINKGTTMKQVIRVRKSVLQSIQNF